MLCMQKLFIGRLLDYINQAGIVQYLGDVLLIQTSYYKCSDAIMYFPNTIKLDIGNKKIFLRSEIPWISHNLI